MAVYTPVTEHEVRALLTAYPLGELISLQGISAGIENSNFFVDTTRGRFVLTIFERLSEAHLPAYLGLMRHLAARGIPCPDPIADRTGALHARLHGKPCAWVTRLSGAAVDTPAPQHCAELGALLARMHRAAADFTALPDNPRGRPWWEAIAPQVRPFLTQSQSELLDQELTAQRVFAASPGFAQLPQGAVHADLFRDNVLFDRPGAAGDAPRVSGVIDFYFAGRDTWLYDLAVSVNDWCIEEPGGEFHPNRLAALLAAYRREREPLPIEHQAWPLMLRAAALRFWLSRLHDLHCPRPAEVVQPKDPAHFERLLRSRRERAVPLDRQ